MILSKLFLIITVFSLSQLKAQTYNGFSNGDGQFIHKEWSLENWDDGGEISRYTFLNMSEFWAHAVINRNGTVNRLIEDYQPEVENFVTQSDLGRMSLQNYVDSGDVDGFIVLQGNSIAFEAYPRMFSFEKHTYMSVSKVFASTLIAILEDRNQLDVSKPIDSYLPELKGSGWENVPIIDILDMSSGIDCLEWQEGAYDNPETCYYQYEASIGLLRRTEKTANNAFDYVKTLSSHGASGKTFEYTSVNTFILSKLVEIITDISYAKNIELEIWQKMGAASDAIMARTNGMDIAHAGISSTLRDLARFGYLFLPSGRSNNDSIISNSYLNKIQHGGRPALLYTEKSNTEEDPPNHNTYQWDKVMKDGDFYKGGFSGQGLYVSPSRNLVIAFFGTADKNGKTNELAKISRQLAKSGLFDK